MIYFSHIFLKKNHILNYDFDTIFKINLTPNFKDV